MYHYRLYYLHDNQDSNIKKYASETPVNPRDIIEPGDGYYYWVVSRQEQKTGVRLNLSKSAESPQEAELLATQYGDV